jgi:hypothetical protein
MPADSRFPQPSAHFVLELSRCNLVCVCNTADSERGKQGRVALGHVIMLQPAHVEYRTDIVDNLFAARQERSPESATRLLNNAASLAKQWLKENGAAEAICFRIQALSELALLQSSRETRKKKWHDALSDHGPQRSPKTGQ